MSIGFFCSCSPCLIFGPPYVCSCGNNPKFFVLITWVPQDFQLTTGKQVAQTVEWESASSKFLGRRWFRHMGGFLRGILNFSIFFWDQTMQMYYVTFKDFLTKNCASNKVEGFFFRHSSRTWLTPTITTTIQIHEVYPPWSLTWPLKKGFPKWKVVLVFQASIFRVRKCLFWGG